MTAPQSATKLARAARKRGVKPHVPKEGGAWEKERDDANTEAARCRDLMETAKRLLGVYCRSNSIDDTECQRIADRVNYEHSEKNHLRNANLVWRFLDIGEVILDGDEQTYRGDETEIWYPVARWNIGEPIVSKEDLKFRRRIIPAK